MAKTGRPPLNFVKNSNFDPRADQPLIEPPEDFTAANRAEWQQLLRTHPDLNRPEHKIVLEPLVLAIGRQREAQRLIQEDGLVVETLQGIKSHPACAIAHQTGQVIARLTKQLGIGKPPAAKSDNPLLNPGPRPGRPGRPSRLA